MQALVRNRMPRRTTKPPGIVTPGGSSSRTESTLESIPHELGVAFSRDDMFYMILSAMDFASDPSNVRRKAGLYANLLKRTVPDTQFTRLRTARLLEGFETLSKAVRVILTIEDFDVLAEVQSILIEGLQDLSRVSDPTTGVTIEGASVQFSEAVAGVLLKLQQNRDPRVRNALRVIAEAKRILDLTQPLPRLPPVDAIDITTFKPVRPRRRSKKR